MQSQKRKFDEHIARMASDDPKYIWFAVLGGLYLYCVVLLGPMLQWLSTVLDGTALMSLSVLLGFGPWIVLAAVGIQLLLSQPQSVVEKILSFLFIWTVLVNAVFWSLIVWLEVALRGCNEAGCGDAYLFAFPPWAGAQFLAVGYALVFGLYAASLSMHNQKIKRSFVIRFIVAGVLCLLLFIGPLLLLPR